MKKYRKIEVILDILDGVWGLLLIQTFFKIETPLWHVKKKFPTHWEIFPIFFLVLQLWWLPLAMCLFSFLIKTRFSSKCTRTKVRTRKKSTLSLRCPHEVVVAAFRGDKVSEPSTPVTQFEDCAHCKKKFDISTGGRCPECTSGVFYCTKTCQVSFKGF